jgi:hypothetical protein
VLSAQSAESWHASRTSFSYFHYPFREACLAYTHFHSPSQSRESSPRRPSSPRKPMRESTLPPNRLCNARGVFTDSKLVWRGQNNDSKSP